jgi:hypothetical protein
MIRPRNLAILAGAAAAAVAVLRHGHHAARGHTVAGGILIGHTGAYDTLTRRLLGPSTGASPATSRQPPPPAHGSSRSAADPATSRSGWPAGTASR